MPLGRARRWTGSSGGCLRINATQPSTNLAKSMTCLPSLTDHLHTCLAWLTGLGGGGGGLLWAGLRAQECLKLHSSCWLDITDPLVNDQHHCHPPTQLALAILRSTPACPGCTPKHARLVIEAFGPTRRCMQDAVEAAEHQLAGGSGVQAAVPDPAGLQNHPHTLCGPHRASLRGSRAPEAGATVCPTYHSINYAFPAKCWKRLTCPRICWSCLSP